MRFEVIVRFRSVICHHLLLSISIDLSMYVVDRMDTFTFSILVSPADHFIEQCQQFSGQPRMSNTDQKSETAAALRWLSRRTFRWYSTAFLRLDERDRWSFQMNLVCNRCTIIVECKFASNHLRPKLSFDFRTPPPPPVSVDPLRVRLFPQDSDEEYNEDHVYL